MNNALSTQSSSPCDSQDSLTFAPVRRLMLQLTGTIEKKWKCHMTSRAMDRKKLMLLMALCLIFATAVPMIVLAAG